MKLKYKNKYIDLVECKSFFSRFRGFMGKTNISNAILFNHCNSIHTFFMKENIDVIMCNKDNVVLYYYANIGKNKVIFPKTDVYKVFELPVRFFDIRINDKLEVIK